MKTTRCFALAALTTALLASVPLVRAETMDDMKFGDIMTPKMMDTNKDGMVSRQEFLDMMGKMWDAKAKKMNVKGGKMTMTEWNEVAMYLKAGS